ncbi:MAG: hypothetical protein IPI06_04855 [Gammaproteobacteria bacterium]|nr:hypothetical protein [Gammaproteobacteria bacterium]
MITRSLPSTRSLWSAAFLACGLFCAAAAPSADKIRIGIVMPKAQLGQGAGGADVAEPVRQTLIAYLSGPATELVPLQARIPIQANTEAQQAGCQYVLYTSVTHKKGGGGAGFGRLMGAVAPMAGMVPGLGGLGGSAGAMVASQAAAVAASAAAQAQAQQAQEQAMAALTNASQSQIRKGDQITLEYKLQKPSEAKAAMEKTGKAKATQDGEDLLSPLIEAAATEVLTAATK